MKEWRLFEEVPRIKASNWDLLVEVEGNKPTCVFSIHLFISHICQSNVGRYFKILNFWLRPDNKPAAGAKAKAAVGPQDCDKTPQSD